MSGASGYPSEATTTPTAAAPAARCHGTLHQPSIADRAAEQRRGQVAVEERQHDLRLGVAEAGVELEHHRSIGGQHQAGVQHAAVGKPSRAMRQAIGSKTSAIVRSSSGVPNQGTGL